MSAKRMRAMRREAEWFGNICRHYIKQALNKNYDWGDAPINSAYLCAVEAAAYADAYLDELRDNSWITPPSSPPPDTPAAPQ